MRTGGSGFEGRGLDGILVHDWGGYPFPLQLSRELARRGNRVGHHYCSARAGCKGRITPAVSDPGLLTITGVAGVARFATHDFVRRVFHEIRYGLAIARCVRRGRYALVISANTPLFTQWLLMLAARRVGARFVFWQQDMLGPGARAVLARKLGRVGDAAGKVLCALEGRLVRRSDAVVAISEDYREQLGRWRVRPSRLHVIQNWGPLDELPERPRGNAWAEQQRLGERPVFLYSGTMALKHDPSLLLNLARGLEESADVVVISEGGGADWLRDAQDRPSNLHVLPFVPYDQLPNALGAADVLVAVLREHAGVFSVPSKVLTYLCAGRAILAAVPSTNLAARVLERSGAGIVVQPDDASGFVKAGVKLTNDSGLRERMGDRARSYAEAEFDITLIADRFEAVFRSVRDESAVDRPSA